VTVNIDWAAFFQVFGAALVSAVLIVACYAAGLRLLVRGGKVPVVHPADFEDAITRITPKEAARATKAAKKAAKKNPLTPAQRRVALVGAYLCFAVCVAAVIVGLFIIVMHF